MLNKRKMVEMLIRKQGPKGIPEISEEIGVSYPTVYRFIKEDSTVESFSMETLAKILDWLEVEVVDVL